MPLNATELTPPPAFLTRNKMSSYSGQWRSPLTGDEGARAAERLSLNLLGSPPKSPAYVAAINSNDTETLMADLTDDIVYQAPSEPEIVGKDAVRKWVAGYFDAYRTTWEKTSIGITVIGDWAFERYEYKSTDVDKKTGAVTTDKGKGINIFRRGTDGKWRVAIDGCCSDIPIAK